MFEKIKLVFEKVKYLSEKILFNCFCFFFFFRKGFLNQIKKKCLQSKIFFLKITLYNKS